MAVAADPGESELVGRAAESAVLTRAWAAAAAGRGQAVLISGEAGIGKSELAAGLAAAARAGGATCLWGAGAEDGGAPAYWPWRQVLRALVRDRGPACLGADAPLLEPLVGQAAASSPFALQEAVCDVLVRAGPLLVVLDDLHVADPASVRLARFVAGGIREAAVLLVATVRPAEADIDPSLGEAVDALAATAVPIALDGLAAPEVAELLCRGTGTPPPPDLVERVLARTDGNPLFVREIARLGGAQWEIPASIRQALRRRLGALRSAEGADSAPARALLEVGAVVGRTFDLATVSAVSGHPWEELAPLVDRAAAARLLEPLADGDSVRFRHVLVRDTVYDDLPATRRAQLHAAVAAYLDARLDADDPGRAAALAHHHRRAVPVVDIDTAATSLEAAGREAARAMVHETAAGHFQDAVRVLERQVPVDLTRRCRLLIALGEARTKGGDPAGGREVLTQAATLARRLSDDEAFALAALRSADRLDFNDLDHPGLALLREAAVRGSPQRPRVLARLAVATYHADRDEAIRLSEAAVADARRGGDPVTLAHALSGWVYAVWGRHDPAAVLTVADEIVALGRAVGDPETEIEGRLWRIVFRLETAAVPAVEREVHAVARLAERLRQPLHRLLAASRAATLATLRGRFAAAAAHAREAWTVGTRGHEPDADAVYWGQVFSIWWLDPDAVDEADIAAMEGIVRRLAAGSPVSAHAPGLALVCLRRGSREEGVARYEAVREAGAAAFPTDMLRVWSLCVIATVCVELGDTAFAEELYAALLPSADRVAVAAGAVACAGAVSHYLGMLAVCAGRPGDAARHLADAVATHERMGAEPMLAASRAWQAGLAPSGFSLRREGELWVASHGRRAVRLPDRKGLGYLAVLVAAPSRPVPALDLLTGGRPAPVEDGLHAHTGGASDEILDATARAAYRTRITDLRAEIDEARSWHDTERGARLETELEFLVEELTAATGLGGRPRRTPNAAERARVSVTRAIRNAIAAVAAADAEMGRFLDEHVRTGSTCSYEP